MQDDKRLAKERTAIETMVKDWLYGIFGSIEFGGTLFLGKSRCVYVHIYIYILYIQWDLSK